LEGDGEREREREKEVESVKSEEEEREGRAGEKEWAPPHAGVGSMGREMKTG